jgi:hypothetical protein
VFCAWWIAFAVRGVRTRTVGRSAAIVVAVVGGLVPGLVFWPLPITPLLLLRVVGGQGYRYWRQSSAAGREAVRWPLLGVLLLLTIVRTDTPRIQTPRPERHRRRQQPFRRQRPQACQPPQHGEHDAPNDRSRTTPIMRTEHPARVGTSNQTGHEPPT